MRRREVFFWLGEKRDEEKSEKSYLKNSRCFSFLIQAHKLASKYLTHTRRYTSSNFTKRREYEYTQNKFRHIFFFATLRFPLWANKLKAARRKGTPSKTHHISPLRAPLAFEYECKKLSAIIFIMLSRTRPRTNVRLAFRLSWWIINRHTLKLYFIWYNFRSLLLTRFFIFCFHKRASRPRVALRLQIDFLWPPFDLSRVAQRSSRMKLQFSILLWLEQKCWNSNKSLDSRDKVNFSFFSSFFEQCENTNAGRGEFSKEFFSFSCVYTFRVSMKSFPFSLFLSLFRVKSKFLSMFADYSTNSKSIVYCERP